MTRRMAWGLFVFFAKAFIWVALAHLAVDLAAMANDLPPDAPDIVDGRAMAGFFVAGVYGFLYGRDLKRG
jgi:hypothetical protein